DRRFLPVWAQLHPRFGPPALAIAWPATLAALLVLLGTFNEIVAYFAFTIVVFVALSVPAVFVLRRRTRASDFAYRTPGYPAPPLIFLLLVALLLVLLAGNNPKQVALGVGVVALGLPVYYLFLRRRFVVETDER